MKLEEANIPYNLATTFIIALHMPSRPGHQGNHVLNLQGNEIPTIFLGEKRRSENKICKIS